MTDLEKEKDELLKLIEEHIDPELMKALEAISACAIEETQEKTISISTEGTVNASAI